MDFIAIIQSKPALIGLHLGFAIIGIDAFLWLFGKLRGHGDQSQRGLIATAIVGVFSFAASWIFGGYYYVIHYGTLVRPIIKSGEVPWAHNIVMEVKEHIFLFIIPLAMTALFITLLDSETMERLKLRKLAGYLALTIALLGLLIGAMGFIVSMAARWGVFN